MSTEERLKRLGLEHLKDNPQELEQEIEKQLAERHQKEKEWEKQQAEKRLTNKQIEQENS
ncbi:hypothetical protein BCD64_15450 [Nostoc sp. MBR 210]|uniref:Uncharacterized protein n=1 Tax=Nostoc spongiaeforme FACHB-130 TaxID=1357510 RepID=A0ABR8FZK1_9NOSO|nr:hypothetical protein [Nostoc spongiaeforme]MBD2596170.1 hypothetical protein [Nostoc spongiaeforme FACHB-130]OCQ96984.1 hypothetical protein BCD64_15450 [Nostoc sp. MBR 210]